MDPEDHDSWFVLVFSPMGGSLEEAHTPASNTCGCGDNLCCMRPRPLASRAYMLQARTDGFEFIEPDTRGTLALVRKGGHYGANLDVSFSVRGAAGEFVPLAPPQRFAIESVPFSKPPRCRGMLKRALARSRPCAPPPL